MDESAIERVLKFSSHLRNSTDVLLGQSGVVSVDSWTLYEIEEAFSLIVEAEQLTDFHVLPPNHRHHPAIPQIQFLYDILQKIKKLKILSLPRQTLPREQYISLKCFRNLNSLELNCIPIQQVKGLQNLRPTLKSLIAQKVCTRLEDILGKCGADHSSEYSWENLMIANFTGNPLKLIDNSVHLLTSIKVLDLSYCELENISALFCLPIVSKLDLSYNKLTTVPLLSEAASDSLVALDLSNNMVMDIKGIEMFHNLQELDLKENFINLETTLIHLGCLSNLKFLNIMRNPVTCSMNYRVHVLKCLHPKTKLYQQFILDSSPLEYSERNMIGTQFEPFQQTFAGTRLLKLLSEKVTCLICSPRELPIRDNRTISECSEGSMMESIEVNIHLPQSVNCKKKHFRNEDLRKTSRKNRTRHVSIVEQDAPDINLPVATSLSKLLLSRFATYPNNNVHESKSECFNKHFIEKEELTQIQNIHQDSFTIKEPLQSDKLLDEILHSRMEIIEDESHIDLKLPSIAPMNKSITDTSMISSTNSSICMDNEACTKVSSVALSPIDTDDEDLEPNKENYTILGKWERKLIDKNVPVDSEYAFLSFSDYYYKEKHTLSNGTMVKMCISSLICMEVLDDKPIKIQLCFNHSNPELRSRVFTLEEDQFERIKIIVEPIIQRNSTKLELLKPPPLCKKCGFIFKGLMAPASGVYTWNEDYCNFCGNYVKNMIYFPSNEEKENYLLHSTPLREISNLNNKSERPQSQNNNGDRTEKHKRQKSNAHSSDSSESFSVCSSEVSQVRRESDLEIISNPSISSIEVLTDQLQEIGDDEFPVSATLNYDTPLSSHELKIENKIIASSKQDLTLMQESSSSGSMTGSVCTAVDRLSTGPNTPMKSRDDSVKISYSQENLYSDQILPSSSSPSLPIGDMAEGSFNSGTPYETSYLSTSSKSTDTVCHRPHTLKQALSQLPLHATARKGIILQDSPENYKLERWLLSLLNGYTGYNWLWWNEYFYVTFKPLSLPSNPIIYCYKNYSQIDHRLQLYAEVFLFKEDNERQQGLIKANMIIDNEEPFLGLLMISNCSIYILKMDSDQDSSPQNWLKENYSSPIHNVDVIYSLIEGQGISIKIKETSILIILAASVTTSIFYNFLTRIFQTLSIDYTLENCSSIQQSNLMEQITLLGHLSEDNEIQLFQIVSLLQKDGFSLNKYLLITSTNVFLFDADLRWLLPRQFTDAWPKLKLHDSFRIDDITSMHILSDTIFRMQFYAEGGRPLKEALMFHVASSETACQVIQAVRSAWIKIFAIDFELLSESSDFLIIKEILKDSSFSNYFQ